LYDFTADNKVAFCKTRGHAPMLSNYNNAEAARVTGLAATRFSSSEISQHFFPMASSVKVKEAMGKKALG